MFKVTTTIYSPDYEDQEFIHFRESSWNKVTEMSQGGLTDGEREVNYLDNCTVLARTFVDYVAAEDWQNWLISNIPSKWKDGKISNVIEEIS